MICPKCKKGKIKVTKTSTITHELETDDNGLIVESTGTYNSTELDGYSGECDNEECQQYYEVNDDGQVML